MKSDILSTGWLIGDQNNENRKENYSYQICIL